MQPAPNNPVLYVDEYGIHVGNHIYRATFPATSTAPTGVHLNITGGNAFGYSVWLNGGYIGSWLGLSYLGTGAADFSFSNATLAPPSENSSNVLTIVMDNSGHDLREAALAPRGILNATLLGPGPAAAHAFGEWKIAGTAGTAGGGGGGGGSRPPLDPVRGPLNEGGLYAERTGAHLPGYRPDDAAAWSPVPPPSSSSSSNGTTTTLGVPGAGVRVFRAVVPLRVPPGLDVSVTFRFSAPPGARGARALLFVNGYQYGRFSPRVGNQAGFPVPPGVLDYGGDNTVAVTVWSQSAEGAEVGLGWGLDYVHAGAFDVGFGGAYLRPGWTAERLLYA